MAKKSPPADNGTTARRRQPKQSRSQETWNAILDAAAELFAAQGYEQTTTHQIAGRAGVSVGALYRYFADKQAVLKELFHRDVSQRRQQVLAEFHLPDLLSQDIHSAVRQTLDMAFRVNESNPALRRVLEEQARKVPELVKVRMDQEHVLQLAIAQILRTVPEVRLPDVEVGAYLVRLFIDSLIDDHVLYGRGAGELDRDRIVDGAVDFLLSYLLGRPLPPPSGEPTHQEE